MVMSVAFATDQRSVALCPRSMLRGSPVKLLMLGRLPESGGGSGVARTGVAGGGGAGAFFVQPAPSNAKPSVNPSAIPAVLPLCNLFCLVLMLKLFCLPRYPLGRPRHAARVLL